MVDSFDAYLIVDAKDNRAAASVREGDDSLRDSFRIRELNFQFEIGILAAADEAHQLSASSERRGRLIEIFLERAVSDRFIALRAAEAFASHLCNGGAGLPARTRIKRAAGISS